MSFDFRSETEDTETTSSDESHTGIVAKPHSQIRQILSQDVEYWICLLQRYVTLENSNLSKNWVSQFDSTMKQFVIDEDSNSLFIYTDKDRFIKATLRLPDECFCQSVYFIKNSSFINFASGDNLNSIVEFGNVDSNFEDSLLILLETIYTPAFYSFNNASTAVQKFTTYLAEIGYVTRGLSNLYAPVVPDIKNQVAVEKNVLSLLEDAMINWCRQIRIAIDDNKINYQMVNIISPLSELNFWRYKCDNLKFIILQLNHPYVSKICRLLRGTNSACIDQMDVVKQLLKNTLSDSVLNVKCVHILQNSCKSLNNTTLNGDDMLQIILEVLYKIDVICETSAHYKTWVETEHLITSLSYQIIRICCKFIHVQTILSGKPDCYIDHLLSTLLLCKRYKIMYAMVADLHNEKSDIRWKKESQMIFNPIDVFVHHCENLKYIFQLSNVFRKSEISKSAELAVCVDQCLNIRTKCNRVSKLFLAFLEELNSVNDIFAALQNVLFKVYERFYDTLETIQNNLTEIFEDSFELVDDVEHGLAVLRLIFYYSKLPSINSIYHQKTTHVYNIFLKELDESYNEIIFETDLTNINQTSVDIKKVVNLFAKKRRLQQAYRSLADCSCWLPRCGIVSNLKYNYLSLASMLDNCIIKAYVIWKRNLSSSTRNKLKRPLIQKCYTIPGLYEINIDRSLIKIHKDAKIWIQLGFVVPIEGKEIDCLMKLYRNVESLVTDYNKIISNVCAEEYALFYNIIRSCKNVIKPAMNKLQWNQEGVGECVDRIHNHIKNCENKIKTYKQLSKEMIVICEMIYHLELMDNRMRKTHQLDELEKIIKFNTFNNAKQILGYYNDICTLLTTVYMELGSYIKQTKNIWLQYVQKIDSLFEAALKMYVKNSLNTLTTLIMEKNGHTANEFHISVAMRIIDDKVQFVPTITHVTSFIMNVYPNILLTLSLVPRICNTFNMGLRDKKSSYARCIAMDAEIIDFQKKILTAVYDAVMELKKITKLNLAEYRTIWKTNLKPYMAEYIKLKPDAASFNCDIQMYQKIISGVEQLKHRNCIHFFSIDAQYLVEAIKSHCKNLITSLLNLLENYILNIINELFMFIKNSENRILECFSNIPDLCDYVNQLHYEMERKKLLNGSIITYLQVFGQNGFSIPQKLIIKQTDLRTSWKRFENILDHCRIKISYRNEE